MALSSASTNLVSLNASPSTSPFSLDASPSISPIPVMSLVSPANKSTSKWKIYVALSLIVVILIAVVMGIWYKYGKSNSSANNSSTINSAPSAAKNIIQTSVSLPKVTISLGSLYISPNSNTDNDLAVLKPATSDVSQTWQLIPQVTISNVTGTQIQNAQTKGLLAVNGGLGKIIVAPSTISSTATLWNLPLPTNSTSSSGNTSTSVITPADPIYAPPKESVQLVLDQSVDNSVAVQQAIQQSVTSSAQQDALTAYSGQSNLVYSGTPCTLTPQGTTNTQTFTITQS